jgi:hypothetical protein
MKSKGEKLWLQTVDFRQDDRILTRMVEKLGLKKWKSISEELKSNHNIFRTPKQCRDRWYNNLKITQNTDLTQEQVTQLFDLIDNHGAKWSMFSNILKTKTENQLKNFVNATIRRNVRRFNYLKNFDEKIHSKSLELLKIPEIRAILTAPKNTPKSWFSDQTLGEQSKRKMNELGIMKKIITQHSPQIDDYENVYYEEEIFFSSTLQENGSLLDLELLLDSI